MLQSNWRDSRGDNGPPRICLVARRVQDASRRTLLSRSSPVVSQTIAWVTVESSLSLFTSQRPPVWSYRKRLASWLKKMLPSVPHFLRYYSVSSSYTSLELIRLAWDTEICTFNNPLDTGEVCPSIVSVWAKSDAQFSLAWYLTVVWLMQVPDLVIKISPVGY